MNCEFCQSPVHIWFDCPKKPVGWKPARLATKSQVEKSAPASRSRTEQSGFASDIEEPTPETYKSVDADYASKVSAAAVVQFESGASIGEGLASPAKVRDAGTANTKDAPKFDKAAWMRANMPAYMKRYRAEVKAGIRVPKPRTGDKT